MKTLFSISLLLFTLATQSAFAQFDDNSSFQSSSTDSSFTPSSNDSGGGGSWGTPSEPSTSWTASNDSSNASSGGGFLSSITSSNNDDDSSSRQASSGSGSYYSGAQSNSGGGFFSPTVQAPTWKESVFNSDTNPLIGAFAGLPTQTTQPYHSTQSFAALLTSRHPLALFVDLNGDGVRGDLWDGMLFNLFYGHSMTSNETYAVATDGRRARGSVTESKRDAKAEANIRNGLQIARIALTDKLNNGQEAASIQELIAILYPKDGDSGAVLNDRQIALSSVLNILTLYPALATGTGPIMQLTPQDVNAKTDALSRAIWGDAFTTRSFDYRRRGNELALEANIQRLALTMALAESQIAKSAAYGRRTETLDAIRAALYMTAFEVKRLKIDDDKAEQIIKGIAQALAEQTPLTLRVAAEKATTPDTLARLEASIVKSAPVVSSGGGMGRFGRYTTSALASGAVIGLWMAGGSWAVEQLGAGIEPQVLADIAGTYVVPPVVAMATNWILKPAHVSVVRSDVRASYKTLCEESLLKVRK